MKILKKIKFGKTEKKHTFIQDNRVFLGISYYRNHIYKPREEIIDKNYFVEWMISNSELAV